MFSSRLTSLSLAFRNQARSFYDLVRVVEVGPRDGLQNELKILPTATKVALVEKLAETGLKAIEVASFVSPKWVPQMGDALEVYSAIKKKPDVEYSVLVPNEAGLQRAISVGVKEVAVFIAASESFSKRNTNCSVEESLNRAINIQNLCKKHKIKTRAYISCVAGCPYEGDVKPSTVAHLSEKLLTAGCYEISLGDTIGIATPTKVAKILDEIKKVTNGDLWRFAVHFHDTYGQALVNVYESLNQGIRVFDSSVAGLGGCPYAAGASGNLATEDLLYLLHGEGMETGVDLEKVVRVGDFISAELDRRNNSKVSCALLAKENIQFSKKNQAVN